MKTHHFKYSWISFVLLFLSAGVQLQAQQMKSGHPDLQTTKIKAEAGDVVAQCDLGRMYQYGDGVSKDSVEAIRWFRKAAEQNYAPAQHNLGWMYENGYGVDQNFVEAARWYRKAAEQGYSLAQNNLSLMYKRGIGVETNLTEAFKWCCEAANRGYIEAEFNLGVMYENGQGVKTNDTEAFRWYLKAAEQGDALSQTSVGNMYGSGRGVAKDFSLAAKWWRRAAEQNDAEAQYNLGSMYYDAKDYTDAVKWFRKAGNQGFIKAEKDLSLCYLMGFGVKQDVREYDKIVNKLANEGDASAQALVGICYEKGIRVRQDYVEAYKWYNLAAAQGDTNGVYGRNNIVNLMTTEQIAEAQKLSAAFVPRSETPKSNTDSPKSVGTGFFITDDGYLITNNHVVKDATKVRIVTSAGTVEAKVIQTDAADDLALLKADGQFAPLPIAPSRKVSLGSTVATVGFPDPGLQGFSPKLAKGEIASLSGAGDDARYFQISVPVQPGNSGGALVDEHGNVVGIVAAKLNAAAALASSGALPENVNYAIKSSYLLSFLESVPGVESKLKTPLVADRKFEDVVRSAQNASVLVLVY